MTDRTDRGPDMIRARLADLFAAADLAIGDDDLDRMVALVEENLAAGERVRRLVERYDEPAFGLPGRRRAAP